VLAGFSEQKCLEKQAGARVLFIQFRIAWGIMTVGWAGFICPRGGGIRTSSVGTPGLKPAGAKGCPPYKAAKPDYSP
jgi:hypothetical protein